MTLFSRWIPSRLWIAIGFVVVTTASSTAAPTTENPDVPDVIAAFNRIDPKGSPFAIGAGGLIPFPLFSYNAYHDYQADHFQGVQRLSGGPYFVISGSNLGRHGRKLVSPIPEDYDRFSDPEGFRGHLFIARLESRPAKGPWRSNVDMQTGQPPASDRFSAAVKIEFKTPGGTALWHPGGISVVGQMLVVPFENYLAPVGEITSQVLFYDVSDPLHPQLRPERILRDRDPFKAKAGAAAMVRLRDKRYLVAARDTSHMSFYFSRTSDFSDGFEPQPRFVMDERDARAVPGLDVKHFSGQTFQFVRQKDGAIFAVSFRSFKLPTGASHVASLWRLDFEGGDTSIAPTLTRVADKTVGETLLGPRGWGDFEAAAGLYVAKDGTLALYGAGRWLARAVAGDPDLPLTSADYVKPGDSLFLPAAEFWPVDAGSQRR